MSLGPHGALLATEHASQRFSAIPMRGGSGVGADDAMVAAITVGLSRGWRLVKSVRLGIAAGAAMPMTPGTAACERADVEKLFALSTEPSDVNGTGRVLAPDPQHPGMLGPSTTEPTASHGLSSRPSSVSTPRDGARARP